MTNVKLSKLWDQLHSSYWFMPAVMAVVRRCVGEASRREAACRQTSLLGLVAGSMISVAATALFT
jgi:uncharacterized membrane protein